MTEETKAILEDLKSYRSDCMELFRDNHINDDFFQGLEAVAHVQTAITGILQEELLEMKIAQAQEQKTKFGKFEV